MLYPIELRVPKAIFNATLSLREVQFATRWVCGCIAASTSISERGLNLGPAAGWDVPALRPATKSGAYCSQFRGIFLPFSAAACYKANMASGLTIGFLGAGKMATALAKGFIRAGLVSPAEIIASDFSESAAASFAPSIIEIIARI